MSWLLLLLLTIVSLPGCIGPFAPDELKVVATTEFEVDASILNLFVGDEREQLLHYLACDGMWRVADSPLPDWLLGSRIWPDTLTAELRTVPSLFKATWTEYRNAVIAETIERASTAVMTGGTGDCALSLRLYLKRSSYGDNEALTTVGEPASRRRITIKLLGSKSGLNEGPSGDWLHSSVVIQGKEIAMVVSESSYSKNRDMTRKVVTEVLEYLTTAAKAMRKERETEAALLAMGSVRAGNRDEFKLDVGQLWGYANTGTPGVLKLRVIPTEKSRPYHTSWGIRGEIKETALVGWSERPDERFFFAIPWSVPGDGNGPVFDGFNYELWFSPANGQPARLLFSHCFVD